MSSNFFDPAISVQSHDPIEAPLRHGHHGDPGAHYDPNGLFQQTIAPDMAAITDQLNGWKDPADLAKERDDQLWERCGDILGGFLRYMAEPLQFLPEGRRPSRQQRELLERMGLRACAAILAIRPALLPPDAQSQSDLARKLGLVKQSLSRMTGYLFRAAHGHFQHGGGMMSGRVRAVASRRSIRVHRRLKHKIHKRRGKT